MTSLVTSTIAFFVAVIFIRRYLDSIDAPRGMTRSILTYCVALMIAYGVAALVDVVIG